MTKDFLFRTASVFMLVGTLSSSIPVLAAGGDSQYRDESLLLPSKATVKISIANHFSTPPNKQKKSPTLAKCVFKHPFLASTTAFLTGAVVTGGVLAIAYYQGLLHPECLQGVITNQTSDPSTETTAPHTANSNLLTPIYGFFAEFHGLSLKEARHFCGGTDDYVMESIEHMISYATEYFPDFARKVTKPSNSNELKELCRNMLGVFRSLFPGNAWIIR
jgi:hypothetical protein